MSAHEAIRKELERISKPCDDKTGHHISRDLKTCPSFPLYRHYCGRSICVHCAKPCKGWCGDTLICGICANGPEGQFCKKCVYTIRYSSGCN